MTLERRLTGHGLKYSLFYGREGKRIVGRANRPGVGWSRRCNWPWRLRRPCANTSKFRRFCHQTGDITVTEAAMKLGVNRVTLSRVVTGSSGVSADMAYRLGEAFGTSPELWAGMQLQYDFYQAGKVKPSALITTLL